MNQKENIPSFGVGHHFKFNVTSVELVSELGSS